MPVVNMKGVKATWFKSDLCKERVRYRTKWAALAALKHMQEREPFNSIYAELAPVQCPACDGGWHLVKHEA